MKFIIILLLLSFSAVSVAQEVKKDGKVYQVKKDRIFLEGKDVTETLKSDESVTIFNRAKAISDNLKLKEKAQKQAEKAQKQAKKAEKAQKQAEKAQKRAEKELKEKEKNQKRVEQAQTNLEKTQKKYNKLKKKGKLSPVDEQKWLDKIDKLQSKLNKAKKKLK